MDLRGSHWGNFKWLDPFGRFPGKPNEKPGISDRALFDLMIEKAGLFNGLSVKFLIYTYAGDPNQALWLANQRDAISLVHQAFPTSSLFLRLDHQPYVDPDPGVGIARAPLMARDFAPIINEITQLVQDSQGSPGIYIGIGNEPNHPDEGWNQNRDYFNRWFKEVVWHFWNVYPIPSKYDGGPHGIFYPGLSPNYQDIDWYNDPSTQVILNPTIPGVQQCWASGIEFHTYWQTGNVANLYWGERYKLLWRQSVDQLNPYLPVIIGEWGNSSDDDMDAVKLPEYKEWLANVGRQRTIPNIIATHCYLLDGTPDWQKFILTLNACREIGALNL